MRLSDLSCFCMYWLDIFIGGILTNCSWTSVIRHYPISFTCVSLYEEQHSYLTPQPDCWYRTPLLATHFSFTLLAHREVRIFFVGLLYRLIVAFLLTTFSLRVLIDIICDLLLSSNTWLSPDESTSGTFSSIICTRANFEVKANFVRTRKAMCASPQALSLNVCD